MLERIEVKTERTYSSGNEKPYVVYVDGVKLHTKKAMCIPRRFGTEDAASKAAIKHIKDNQG